jgi:hypothetical protein
MLARRARNSASAQRKTHDALVGRLRELVARKVDVVVALGTPTVPAAKHATSLVSFTQRILVNADARTNGIMIVISAGGTIIRYTISTHRTEAYAF